MSLWEVSLRASYDYPFIELSRGFPETPISMWCIWDRELLHVPSRDPEVIHRFERALRRMGKVIGEWADSATSRIFLLGCTCPRYDSIWNVIESHECWDAPPVVYQDGWANFRVLTFDAARPKELYRDFQRRGSAELVRKRELSLAVLPTSIYPHALFGGMTERQCNALLEAHRRGYYSTPRPTTTEEIAGALGVGRSTYEEHLRKAENRVMAGVIPYLQLFATGERVPERMPEPRPVAPPPRGAVSPADGGASASRRRRRS